MYIREGGLKTKCLDQAFSHGQMVGDMKENTLRIINKEKECLSGQMARYTMVNG